MQVQVDRLEQGSDGGWEGRRREMLEEDFDQEVQREDSSIGKDEEDAGMFVEGEMLVDRHEHQHEQQHREQGARRHQ